MEAWVERIGAAVEARAARRRAAVAAAMTEAGVADVTIDGDGARASARGLAARWMGELALREAGRGGA